MNWLKSCLQGFLSLGPCAVSASSSREQTFWDWQDALPGLQLADKEERQRLDKIRLQKACRGPQALAPGARMVKVSRWPEGRCS